jgi:hypothetical protein
VKILTALVLVALAVAVLAATGATAPTAKPRLTMIAAAPVTVRGSQFRAHERVRVVLHEAAGATVVHRVRAGGRGRFTTSFGTVTLGRCGGFSVTATGALGSRATLRRPQLPACMPVRAE